MTAVEKMRTIVSLTSDNYNVNIQKIGDHLLAISDMAGQMEMDFDTIGTKGIFKYNDTLAKRTSMITCAHPTQLPGDKYRCAARHLAPPAELAPPAPPD